MISSRGYPNKNTSPESLACRSGRVNPGDLSDATTKPEALFHSICVSIKITPAQSLQR